MALVRSSGPVNRLRMSESDTASTMAPPRPCTLRATMRKVWEPAMPQASDALVKSTRPERKTLRWP